MIESYIHTHTHTHIPGLPTSHVNPMDLWANKKRSKLMPTCQGIWNGAQTAHVLHRRSAKCTHENPLNNNAYIFPIAKCFYNCWQSINPTAKARLDWQDAVKPTTTIYQIFKKCMNLHMYFSVDPICIQVST
jgi:hypothetical protein